MKSTADCEGSRSPSGHEDEMTEKCSEKLATEATTPAQIFSPVFSLALHEVHVARLTLWQCTLFHNAGVQCKSFIRETLFCLCVNLQW